MTRYLRSIQVRLVQQENPRTIRVHGYIAKSKVSEEMILSVLDLPHNQKFSTPRHNTPWSRLKLVPARQLRTEVKFDCIAISIVRIATTSRSTAFRVFPLLIMALTRRQTFSKFVVVQRSFRRYAGRRTWLFSQVRHCIQSMRDRAATISQHRMMSGIYDGSFENSDRFIPISHQCAGYFRRLIILVVMKTAIRITCMTSHSQTTSLS